MSRVTRRLRGIAYHQEVWFELTVGVYRARCACAKTFQSSSPRAPTGWRYTLEVREVVLDSIVRDRMPTTTLKERLKEDYLLTVSTGFIYDCLEWGCQQFSREEYLEWARKNFSGVMCIDELHDSKTRKLFMATDPINDFTIYFQIAKKCDQESMNAFLDDLKGRGFAPQVIITDGSQLYKEALFARWKDVEHQLCVFHVLKDANDYILQGVRALAKTLPKPKKYRRGRPKKRGRPRKRDTRRKFIMENVHLVVKRRDDWTKEEQETWEEMLRILPGLETFRQFVDDLHGLFAKDNTKRAARRRRGRLVNNPSYCDNPYLARVCRMLTKDQFEKMITFLGWKDGERTSNHVERSNRSFRMMQKTRYKRRRSETITRALWLVIMRRWKQHPLYAAGAPPEGERASPRPMRARKVA